MLHLLFLFPSLMACSETTPGDLRRGDLSDFEVGNLRLLLFFCGVIFVFLFMIVEAVVFMVVIVIVIVIVFV